MRNARALQRIAIILAVLFALARLPVMAVALLIFSYLLSVYFYQRKEF